MVWQMFAVAAVLELISGVHIVRGTFAPGSQPDGNSIILEAPHGLIVVDTGRHERHTQAVLDFAVQRKRPIVAVINTHWHLDHIGGNLLVRQKYPQAQVYGSGALDDALTGFLARYREQLEQMGGTHGDMRLIDAGAKLGPDVTITTSGRRTIAGRELMLGLEKDAVTAADVWLLDRETGVLIAGDLVTLPAPFLDTASPAGWAAALDRLASLEFHVLVPGHGAPMTRTQFDLYRAAFRSLLQCTSKEECIDEWINSVAPLMIDHDEKFTRSLMSYYVDVLHRHELRNDVPRRD